MKTKQLNMVLMILCILALGIVLWVLYLYNLIEHTQFSDSDFHISYQLSGHDENHNGIDDLLDLWIGAEKEAQLAPTYASVYYEGGYPPETQGVCTDLIWRAFRDAGYDLKAMIDTDIAKCPECYPRIQGRSDPNIDFRRVPNIHVFLERYAASLTLDLSEIEEWQAGDIVIFADRHIGILSNVRNRKGIPFLLHNGGLPKLKEDCLEREHFLKGISGHYRFQYQEQIQGLIQTAKERSIQ